MVGLLDFVGCLEGSGGNRRIFGAEFLVARQCYADRVMTGLSGAA